MDIHFEFDPILPALKIGAIEDMRVDINFGKGELTRTYWAVKDENILKYCLLSVMFLNNN